MGCGCKKSTPAKQMVGTASSQNAVFQVLDSQGQLINEFSTPGEARKAAAAAGGRVRITSRAVANSVV